MNIHCANDNIASYNVFVYSAHIRKHQRKLQMSKLLKRENDDLPEQQNGEIENINTAARADAGYERLLKFKKGDYRVGEEAVPLGTEYLAHVIAWTKVWIKFVNGELIERRTFRVAKGERPLEREDLDDSDETRWPEGIDGRPADPWVFQYLLPFESITSGEIVVFTTSSFGGRRAVADLCAAYAKRAAKYRSGQPIIKLAVTEMPTKKFGKVPRPDFRIVGWDEPSPNAEPVIVPPGDEFRDEIPF